MPRTARRPGSTSRSSAAPKPVESSGSSTQLWGTWEEARSGNTYGQFITFAVDVTALAGRTVVLAFDFESVDEDDNSGEGVYLDDIDVSKDCSIPP